MERRDEDCDKVEGLSVKMEEITVTDIAEKGDEVRQVPSDEGAIEATHPDPESPPIVTTSNNTTETKDEAQPAEQDQPGAKKVNGRLVKSKIVSFNLGSDETVPLDATFDHKAAGMPFVEDIPEGFLESLGLEVVELQTPEPKVKVKGTGDVEKGKKVDGEKSLVEDEIDGDEEKVYWNVRLNAHFLTLSPDFRRK